MTTAQAAVMADNDQVRVTTVTFGAEGATTGPHRHEFDCEHRANASHRYCAGLNQEFTLVVAFHFEPAAVAGS